MLFYFYFIFIYVFVLLNEFIIYVINRILLIASTTGITKYGKGCLVH
jgi:uncharacterized protein YqhQ